MGAAPSTCSGTAWAGPSRPPTPYGTRSGSEACCCPRRRRLPMLIMAGTGDRGVPPPGSVMLHDRAGSPDRTLRLYEGLYHELFNEPERRVVLGDVAAWLEARTVPQHVEAWVLSA